VAPQATKKTVDHLEWWEISKGNILWQKKRKVSTGIEPMHGKYIAIKSGALTTEPLQVCCEIVKKLLLPAQGLFEYF
jgi:hypothetical protein